MAPCGGPFCAPACSAAAGRRCSELPSGAPAPHAATKSSEPWRPSLPRAGTRLQAVLDADVGIFAVAPGPDAGVKTIEVVIDSGAVQSVAPPGLFPGRVEPSPMSAAGRVLRAANGSPIKDLGQVRVDFVSSEGHRCAVPFQVAEVERALLSASHLARAGNKVELDDTGGVIRNRATGKTTQLTRRGGVYVLPLKVSGFPRLGSP